MSKGERQAATDALQKKLQAFRNAVTERGIVEPSRAVIDEFLSQRDLEAAWKMLERQRNKKTQSIKDAWNGLKNLGAENAKKERLNCLTRFIMDQDWENGLIKVIDTYEASKQREKEMVPMYFGELQQQHGRKEAQALIDDGVYKQVLYYHY